MTIQDKLTSKGPYKLLALDGGGIRGIITIEVLRALEEMLRKEVGKGSPDFVLADYFDYIAGTSTGAILATCLTLGMPVSVISDFYQKSGKAMFDLAGIFRRFSHHRFEDEKLADLLKDVIRKKAIENGWEPKHSSDQPTLGSNALRTLLMLVLRNATTDSPWPLSNNPNAKYNDPKLLDCNGALPLWQLVRASTAAPVYFPPEVVKCGENEFIFVDGGITPYNNPAFILYLMSTLAPYKLGWKPGEKNMLLVSIGTGYAAAANKDLRPNEMNLLYNASSIPSALMAASLHEQDMLCRSFGRCHYGNIIDSEIEDMVGPLGEGATPTKLFTYMRYNVELTIDWLKAEGLGEICPADVQALDSVEHMHKLTKVGKAVAKQIKEEHFQGFL